MKKFIFALLGIILFCSCEKFTCGQEDSADKFVGKYELSAISYDGDGFWNDDAEDIVHITKVDANVVHISKLNKYATVEGNNIFIENFHIYDGTRFTEYMFTPGVYVNGTFRINIDVCENTGGHKEYGNIDLIFTKVNK